MTINVLCLIDRYEMFVEKFIISTNTKAEIGFNITEGEYQVRVN
jgi:hypothetical protein